MGSFRVQVEIGDPAGNRFDTIEALVDTRASYTWVSRDLLGRLGVRPEEEWPFVIRRSRL
jgi:hypothetical protein